MRKILVGLFFFSISGFILFCLSPTRTETEKRSIATVPALEISPTKTVENQNQKSSQQLPGKRMPKKYIRQVQKAIESNNLCDLIKVPVHDYDFCFEALEPWLNFAKGNSELEELFSKTSPMFSLSSSKRHGLAARFLEALRMAELLDVCGSSGYTTPNYKEAEKILMDLAQEDSGNAAYPFFRLTLLKLRKAKREEIISALDDMARGDYFDSHLAKITNFIYEVSLRNETFWFHGVSVGSRFPIPSYFGSIRALKELAMDTQESEKVSRVADLMMREALNSKKPYWEMSYIPMEFAMGRSLAVAADPRISAEVVKYEKLFEAGQEFGPDQMPEMTGSKCDQKTVRDFYENIRHFTSVIL